MSHQMSALQTDLFIPSVSIQPQSQTASAFKPGLFWVFGENPKGPLYLYRLNDHRYPAPAIQEIQRLPHSDTSLLMNRLLKEIEHHEEAPQVIHKRSGDIFAVSADIADVELIIAGYFDLNMSSEVPAQPKHTSLPTNTTKDRLTLWEYRSVDVQFLVKEQDAAEKAIVSLEEWPQVSEASMKLLRECFCYASYSMTGADSIRAAFQDIVLRAEQQYAEVAKRTSETYRRREFVRNIVGK
ncbi:hypothetical protein FB567DRAFT_604210 [Paraphoma chrysanthemicola]|uniref:Uncharacterized protein n=1 Tax=Paraphoma chrysanthemicola TaxID=798071 RepID=A0A8K0R5Q0_9PLEO|nr:hypothetical protein FB567DRAFT_604210 [Paraphoma chrysanthemicola]